MLKKIVLGLMLTGLFTEVAAAQTVGADRSKGVLIMSAATDPLPNAFAHEKSCVGLHEVAWGSKDFFGWGLAIAGNGHGAFEVLLQKVEDNHISYHAFLGTNVKNAVRNACNIINGREKANWMAD